jgi:hypothetical protein
MKRPILLAAIVAMVASAVVVGVGQARASAEPTYQRTVNVTCSTTPEVLFWPIWNASADVTIDGQPDGSERIVGVSNFKSWLSQRPYGQPVSWFWITDEWHSSDWPINHRIQESGGKSVDWFVGGNEQALDQTMPVNCFGSFSLP